MLEFIVRENIGVWLCKCVGFVHFMCVDLLVREILVHGFGVKT